ncbi:hypothetical protein ACLOJK_014072 [Asimina triloba]
MVSGGKPLSQPRAIMGKQATTHHMTVQEKQVGDLNRKKQKPVAHDADDDDTELSDLFERIYNFIILLLQKKMKKGETRKHHCFLPRNTPLCFHIAMKQQPTPLPLYNILSPVATSMYSPQGAETSAPLFPPIAPTMCLLHIHKLSAKTSGALSMDVMVKLKIGSVNAEPQLESHS